MLKRRRNKEINLPFKSLSKLVHPCKLDILNTLEKKQKLNFSQLKRELTHLSGKEISLKETRRHANALVSAGLLKKDPKPKQSGHPVFLKLKRNLKK